MKAIILAAGEGKRLRPHTLDRPKCLVEIDGHSLLDRQLDVLHSENVDPIIVVGGYRAEMLRRKNIKLLINPLFSETNMVWTLFCAEADLDDEMILSYGDIVYSREILRSLLKSEVDIAVAIDLDWESYWRTRNDDPLDDAETLKISSDGRILEIGQKPKSLKEIEGQYMGVMKFSAKGVGILKDVYHDAKIAGNLLSKPIQNSYMTDLLQSIIKLGYRVDAVPVHGGWVEVDTSEDYFSETTRSRLQHIRNNL
jgi:choline kinase